MYFTLNIIPPFFQMEDVISIHEACCPNFDKRELQLSSDGVAESLSTSISLDVYSVKFDRCKEIYPIRIIKQLKKNSLDPNEHLRRVVNDINDNQCKITQYVADNLKRSQGKCCLCHSSWFPCEYCFAKGTKLVTNSAETNKKKEGIKMQKMLVTEKLENLRGTAGQNPSQVLKLKNILKKLTQEEKSLKTKKSNIVWPQSSSDGPPRTIEEISEIIDKIENNQVMGIDERKGIVGRSVFFDLPGFNFITCISTEYLHSVCLGVVKKSVELTFKVGESRQRETNRKLSLPSQFNDQIFDVKIFRESNRRIRDLDFAVYKGQEFRNLLLFFFPLILNCIEPGEKERNMWLYLTFMIKACVIPREEFGPVPLDMIETSMKQFYTLYEQLFGMKNCTYNTHVVGSHLLEMRYHGPLTYTSAFPFESFYGELRNSFVPGTVSPLKQVLKNVLIKRVISKHRCENEIYISAKETPKEANNMVYCFERNEYVIYKVQSVEGNMLICYEQEKLLCSFAETPNLPWNLIGVFKKGILRDTPIVINKNDVKGKVVVVNDYLLTCPRNVLNEK